MKNKLRRGPKRGMRTDTGWLSIEALSIMFDIQYVIFFKNQCRKDTVFFNILHDSRANEPLGTCNWLNIS